MTQPEPDQLDACDIDILRKAVTGQLAEDELERVVSHLERCQDCLTCYEELVQGDIRQLVQSRHAETEPDANLAQVLDRTRAASDWIVHQDQKEWRFRIIRKIGQGGMGEIYEAFDTKLNRVVALKKLRPDRLTPELLGRLKQEATIQAGLNHPCIVQIYEVGLLAGMPFLAMEYVHGGSLGQLLSHRPLAATEAALLTAKIAQGMHQAHLAGVLHRDLKPSNILIKPSPEPNKTGFEPKIADFGLAKLMGEASQLSATAVIVGTPAYLSPEQADNRVSEIGPLSDVYSLGVILYESLTGHPPFNANESALLLEMIKGVDPVSPRKLVPGVNKDLETICLKCLAKEPARRYASAAALADDLTRFLEGRPILARPAGRLETAWRWSLRNRRLAASLATILVMAVLFSGFAFWSANNQKRLRRLAEAETNRANRSETLALGQRDQAYFVFLEELQKLKSIVLMLDNPVIKLVNQPGIVQIQADILASIQADSRRFLQDDQLIREKPELVLETLFIEMTVSRMTRDFTSMKRAAGQILKLFPAVKNPPSRLIMHFATSAELLANQMISEQDLPAALAAWHHVWQWLYGSGQRMAEIRKNKAGIAVVNCLQGYRTFLNKAGQHDQAQKVEKAMAVIVGEDGP